MTREERDINKRIRQIDSSLEIARRKHNLKEIEELIDELLCLLTIKEEIMKANSDE